MIHETAVIDFQPMTGKAFARPTHEQPPAVLHSSVAVGPFATVYAGCEIGHDTRVCPYSHIREGAHIGARCVIGVGVKIGYHAQIGDDCQIMDDTHISGGTIIGNRCFIGVHVVIVNDDKPEGYVWKGVTPVRIGNDVRIGSGARIRPGVTIGDGARIAMGALVVKDVPAGAVAKGPVAKVEEVWPDSDCAVVGVICGGEVYA